MGIKWAMFLRWLVVLYCLGLGLSTAFARNHVKNIDLGGQYAIVLSSSSRVFTDKDLDGAYKTNDYRYYVVKIRSKGKIRYQLRLGFFRDIKSAKKMKKNLAYKFDKAYIIKTKQAERNISSQSELMPPEYPRLADYLIVSTAYKTANVLSEVAADMLAIPVKKKTTEDNSEEPVVELVYENYLAINLKTTNNLSEFDKIIKKPIISSHAFYISELNIDGRKWYQYRLGFFVKAAEARKVLASLNKEFPLARLIRVTREEKEDAISRVKSFFASVPDVEAVKPLPKLEKIPENKLDGLMKKAIKSLSDKKYKRAIQQFRHILRYPDNKFAIDAQEYLAFSYELNGQSSIARMEYERYLSLYPGTSGANRVRQRLASLLTAREEAPEELREKKKRKRDVQWQNFGSFSQFYRRDESQLNEENFRQNLSLLSSDVSVSSRYRGEKYIMSSRFIGGHDADFTGDAAKNSGTINTLYFDAGNTDGDYYGKIGRQNVSKNGVLGRMDGAILSYKFNDYVKLNTVGGYVVEDTRKAANTEKSFYGISTDLGTFQNAWDINSYYIHQNEGEITGREAIGSELRYFDPQRTLFALFDYDVMFKSVNTILAIGNWQFKNRIQMNATIDIRKSPFLTTGNALKGRTEQSVNELLGGGMTEKQIRSLALENTATSKTYILGVNAPLSSKLQLSADMTLSKLTSSSNGDGTFDPGTGNEYLYNIQLIGNSILMRSDSTIVGYRFSDTDRGKVNSLNLNIRLPLSREWRINPRFRFDKRDNSNGTKQNINAIAVRIDYRLKRNLNFEIDMGQEKTNTGTLDETTDKSRAYFVNMGYRYDF